MLPFKLLPAYKDYLWGGERLKTIYHKQTPLTPLAESWEVSCHPDGESLVASGPLAGKSLRQLAEGAGKASLLGKNCARFPFFPLLIKLIDAKEPLSIQVHPSDQYALAHENSFGKTEMWVVLDALPGSFIYYGVARPVSAGELRAAIASNTLEGLLGRRPVKAGDVIFIPAGTLHAIGAGILLCEVQQNSNLTYRVYDYGRVTPGGGPRPLHVEKALAVASLAPAAGGFSPRGRRQALGGGGHLTALAGCGYFWAYRLEVAGECPLRQAGDSFVTYTCTNGAGTLLCGGEALPFAAGETLFLPADAGASTLRGDCAGIAALVPPAEEEPVFSL